MVRQIMVFGLGVVTFLGEEKLLIQAYLTTLKNDLEPHLTRAEGLGKCKPRNADTPLNKENQLYQTKLLFY